VSLGSAASSRELVSRRRSGNVPRPTPGPQLPQQPRPHEASQFPPRHLARDATTGHEVSPPELLTLLHCAQRLALYPGERRPRSRLHHGRRAAVGRADLREPNRPEVKILRRHPALAPEDHRPPDDGLELPDVPAPRKPLDEGERPRVTPSIAHDDEKIVAQSKASATSRRGTAGNPVYLTRGCRSSRDEFARIPRSGRDWATAARASGRKPEAARESPTRL
jgi:hypothetical protein